VNPFLTVRPATSAARVGKMGVKDESERLGHRVIVLSRRGWRSRSGR
jgi:hypothetical protein